jgi:NADH-quinone oxidoreductase subunit L
MAELHEEFHGAAAMGLHALSSLPFWLAFAGVALSWFFYMKRPDIPAAIQRNVGALYRLLDNKYYLDDIYFAVFAKGSRALGTLFWKLGDVFLIDGVLVNGAAKLVGWFAKLTRSLQTGYVYHYAVAMIAGLALMILWFGKGLLG